MTRRTFTKMLAMMAALPILVPRWRFTQGWSVEEFYADHFNEMNWPWLMEFDLSLVRFIGFRVIQLQGHAGSSHRELAVIGRAITIIHRPAEGIVVMPWRIRAFGFTGDTRAMNLLISDLTPRHYWESIHSPSLKPTSGMVIPAACKPCNPC